MWYNLLRGLLRILVLGVLTLALLVRTINEFNDLPIFHNCRGSFSSCISTISPTYTFASFDGREFVVVHVFPQDIRFAIHSKSDLKSNGLLLFVLDVVKMLNGSVIPFL